jgi:PAS domain S-box-containing protein
MFHMFLVVICIWTVLGSMTLPLGPRPFFRLFVGSPMQIGAIAALIVIRLGYYRAASLIYVAGVWAMATSATTVMGWIHSPALILYGTLPVTAAWLLGYRAAIWTAGMCISTVLVFAVLEMIGMPPRYATHGTPLGIWWATVHATLIGTIPAAYIIRKLRETLAERQQVEETLRKSEERFRLATNATNDSIWDIDLKTGVVSWNDTYTNLYGRPLETSDSWQWWIENIHPEDREYTVSGLRSAIGGNSSSWNCEYRFRRLGGEWAYVYDRAYIARDASGNPWRVIGAMQDLTERKSAEAALRESEERFRRLFEEGPLGVALVGMDYRFVKVNSALCQMVGYSEAELADKTFTEITHPDDLRTNMELVERLFKREIPTYRLQKRYVKKNAEIIWVNLTASIIHGPDGEPFHGLAMVEDITEIKRTQEEALFRQKLESVGTLAGGIAHDFNNLLGAVHAQAELALAESDAGLSCKEELHAIREATMRGSEIVRQLMIYAGKESADVGLVDLSKTVDEMLSLLKVSVTKHAVIEANLDRDLPAIQASAAQLRQLVMNFIINASDAIGDRDGVIRVTTGRVSLTRESAANFSRPLSNGDYVRLEVSDTGRGMTPETQAKVFDPFFTTKSAGHGLGLAVVQGIVWSLGGAIHLTSEPDQGTTFQVLLPCAEGTAGASGDAMSEAGKLAVPRQHGRVLVVEDEGQLRQAVVKMLRKTGFEVFEAADGSAAIDLLRTDAGKIDVILLDMTIPGASSHEVIAEAAHGQPNLKVILTSAYSRDTVAATTNTSQIRGFIRKPYRLADLVKTLQSSLSS